MTQLYIPGIHPSSVSELHITKEMTGGTLAICPHAYGIGTSSKFTAHAIFDIGVSARNYAEKTFGELRTEPIPLGSEEDYLEYNKFFWIPWNRLSNNVGAFVTKRIQMATPNSYKYIDYTNYVGTKSPADIAWNKYIALEERLAILNKLFKDAGTVHYRVLDIGCGTGSHLVGLGAYGYDVFGIEGDPAMYRARNTMMDGRIVFGDALQDLYVFKAASFNVCIVSCLGSIWWSDLLEFMKQVANVVVKGGLVILDIKEFYGHEFRDKATYLKLMTSVGIHIQLRTSEMLLGVVR